MDEKRRGIRKWLKNSTRTEFFRVIKECKLTPRQKRIVVMRYVQDKMDFQIAMELGVSIDCIRNDFNAIYQRVEKVLAYSQDKVDSWRILKEVG